MTPDERNLLNDLASRFSQTPAAPRDPEAEDIIRTKIGNRPDALYLMTQTVLIQNMALQRAQQQLQDLQSRSSQGPVSGGSSWLGGQQTSAPAPSSQPQYAPPAQSYAAPPAPISGGSSFLRGAAQTAAGVAAGTLAADAIGSMFSHHGGGMFGGGMFGGGSGFTGGGVAPTEEIVNNYYDSPGGGQDFRDAGGQNNFDDSAIANDSGNQFDDNSQFDDSSLDDSNFDDSGSDDNFV